MTRDEMLALAERVETLSHPCREADALIARAICWRWDGWEEGDRKIEEMDLHVLHERVANSWNSIWRNLPAYTASLDCAMALVPDTCTVNLMMGKGRPTTSQVHHFLPGALIPHKQSIASAATPALALTAAALRARASLLSEKGEG